MCESHDKASLFRFRRLWWILIGLLLFSGCDKKSNDSGNGSGNEQGMISGHVTSQLTGGGIYQATVVTNPPTYTAQTDFFGSYFISGVPPGTYAVTITADTYLPSTIHDVSVFNDRNTRIDVALAPVPTIGTISGRVTDSLRQGALANVLIATIPATQTATSSTFGYYTLANIPADTYTVYAALPGYDTARIENFILPGGRTLALNIAMVRQFGSLAGQVTDSISGNPLQNATVYALPDSLSVVTDSLGFYRSDSLAVDTITVRVSRTGYQMKTVNDIVIRKNQTTTVNFQLRQ